MGHFGTKQRFRHTTLGPDGERYLIWASQLGEFKPGLIRVGSREFRELLGDQPWSLNDLANEGKADILDVYFDDQAVRSSLFLRLYNDTPVDIDDLTTLQNEVSGTGYGAITVTRSTDWTAPTAGGGTDMATKTFTAGGTWSAATALVLATSGTGTSGLLIAYNMLSGSRTLTLGQELDVDLNISLE